jgi:hypothetical protein
MSDYFEVGDGVVVDEDGVIIDSPMEQADLLTWAASQLLEEQEQGRLSEQRERLLRRLFLRYQEAPKAAYGDVVVSIPKPGSHPEFDAGGWALWVASAEITADDLRWLLARSRPDYTAMPPGWQRDLAQSFYTTKVHAPYARATRVRKAPRLRVVEREEEAV